MQRVANTGFLVESRNVSEIYEFFEDEFVSGPIGYIQVQSSGITSISSYIDIDDNDYCIRTNIYFEDKKMGLT